MNTEPADRPRILVVDDDRPIRRFLRTSLLSLGYRVDEAESGERALTVAAFTPPDLVILDLGLPDLDGLEVLGRLREWTQVPVVILSARGQERDKVTALDSGADDYLTKPFGVGELMARIRVAFRNHSRRGESEGLPKFEVGDLLVDLAERRVHLGAEELHLTPMEYRLLTTFVRNAGKVLTHGFLLREVWGPKARDDVRYLRVFVAGLRSKIEDNPSRPRYLLTEQGVGYRLVDE